MAIKYNNNKVKVVKFDNNDVKKIIKDGTTVWEKPYTLTESSVDPSIVTYRWKTTYEPSVSSGSAISKTTVTQNKKYVAEVYNEDTITLSYNTDLSQGAIADIVRVDGVDKSSGSDITVTKDVNVEVIAAGKPATLIIDLDQGTNWVEVYYTDTSGQRKQVSFNDSAQHTIDNIWSGTTVYYYIYCKQGHTVDPSYTDLKENTRLTWANASGTKTLTVRTVAEPVTLTVGFPTSDVESVYIEYIDHSGEFKTKIMTSPGVISDNVKYASSYYWKVTKKDTSQGRFPIMEDYGAAGFTNHIYIDVDYKPARIRIRWEDYQNPDTGELEKGLAKEISSVLVQYYHCEYNGYQTAWIDRNDSWSDIENARMGTEAQLIQFYYSRTGCYVRKEDPLTRLELNLNTNVFKNLTVEILDLDPRPVLALSIPAGYQKISFWYINVDGEEIRKEVTGLNGQARTIIIEDAAEGSYVGWEGTLLNGNTYGSGGRGSGTHLYPGYDFNTGSATDGAGTLNDPLSVPIPAPSGSGSSATVVINRKKIENPVFRTINVQVNPNIRWVHVHYYDVDSDGYLVEKCYYSDETTVRSFRALVGFWVYWWGVTVDGCISNPQGEDFRLVESKSDYLISPVANKTYGVIRPIFSKNVATIKVTYCYDLDASGKYYKKDREITSKDSGIDITDALIGTRYEWEATANSGYVLQASKGSGRVSKYWYESKISPEVNTEPYLILLRGDYVDWWAGERLKAAPGDVLEEYRDSSTGVLISCKTPTGGYRWDTSVDRWQDDERYSYSGEITFNKTFPLTLDSSVAPWNDSYNHYTMILEANGITRTLKKYSVARPSTPPGAYGLYVSSNKNATSGDPADATYNYGTTVYCFVAYPLSYKTSHDMPAGWKEVQATSESVTYRISDTGAQVTESSPETTPFTINNLPQLKSFTISLDDTYVRWTSGGSDTVTSKTAYYGDKLTASNSTLTCKDSSGAIRWMIGCVKLEQSAQYEAVTGTINIKITNATVTGKQTITVSGLSKPVRKYTVTLSPSSLTGCNEVFLATSNTATSGTHTSGSFEYGTTVYAIAAVNSTSLGLYTLPSSWGSYKNSSGGYYFYQAGSVYVDGNETISLTAPTARTTFTISFTGNHIVWKQGTKAVTSLTAYKGDTVRNISQSVVTCCYPDAVGNLCERWRVTASKMDNTVQYAYSGTVQITDFTWTISSDKQVSAGGIGRSTQQYAVNISCPSRAQGAFLSTSTGATSGSASGTKFNYGATVYAYVYVSNSALTNYYTAPSSYGTGKVSGSKTYYCVDSFKVDGTAHTFTPENLKARTYKLSLNGGSYVNWTIDGTAVMQATISYGDSLRVTNSASEVLVQCTSTEGTSFTARATKKSNTAQYTYTGTPQGYIGSNTSTTSHQVVGATSINIKGVTQTINTYTISITKPSYAGPYAVRSAVVNTTYTPSNGSVGSNTSLTVDYNTTVYGFIVVDKGFSEAYTTPSSWTLIHYDDSIEVYRVGSKTATTNGSISYTAPTRIIKPVTVSKASYMNSVYLSTSASATSGSSSGANFNAGDTVYAFATLTTTNNSNYNIPSNWSYIGSYGAYYHYRIGSRVVSSTASSNEITYTGATLKPTLSNPAVLASAADGSYGAIIENLNNTTVTANISWYSGSGTLISSTTKTLMAKGKSGNVTDSTIKATYSSAYLVVTFSATGYITSRTTTSTMYRTTLTAPELVSVETGAADDADSRAIFDYYAKIYVKNPNNTNCTIDLESWDGDIGFDSTSILAKSEDYIYVNFNGSATVHVMLTHPYYNESSTIQVHISASGGSGGGGQT